MRFLVFGLPIFIFQLFGQRANYSEFRHSVRFEKDSLEVSFVKELNSSYPETDVSVSKDGQELFFSTSRGGQYWSDSYKKKSIETGISMIIYDSDIWHATWNGHSWTNIQPLPFGINTSHLEEQPFISVDSKFLYYQSWGFIWEETKGPYYVIKRLNGKWGGLKGLGNGITSFFQEYPLSDGIALTPEGKKIFLTSSLHNYAVKEIYVSKKTALGWAYPEVLSLQPEGNKKSISFAPSGNLMFFASDSDIGYGGYDIYVVYFYEGEPVGEPMNLGSSINSEKNEYGFSITEDLSRAYFIREADIYQADMKSWNWQKLVPSFLEEYQKGKND